jgi:hypothetical protein
MQKVSQPTRPIDMSGPCGADSPVHVGGWFTREGNMMKAALVLGALVAAEACTGKADSKTDTTRPPDSAASSVAPPAATNAAVDTTARAVPAASPRPAPGSKAAAPPPGAKAIAADTIRGIVAVVGTDRDKQVIIRPANGPSITLLGPDAALAGRAAGADVWVSGPKADRTMTVTSFAVRMVDGLPAVDGDLTLDGQKLVLVTQTGKRHTIANPPNALRDQVGGRVWVTGNLDQGPVAFGIIKTKP